MAENLDDKTAAPKDAEKKLNPKRQAIKLLKFLEKHKENRGVMADLRCGLIDEKKHRAWPHIVRFYHDSKDQRLEPIVRTIAGLYATHPNTTNEGNFGKMCRKLLSAEERDKLDKAEGVGPISRRFQHLLAADEDEIFERIIRFVLRAKAEERAKAEKISVNYFELYASLYDWRRSNSGVSGSLDRIRADWAKSFWAPFAEEDEDNEGEEV